MRTERPLLPPFEAAADPEFQHPLTRDDRGMLDVTVITACYSMERWELTCAAVQSVLAQTLLPREIILPVDHNPKLLERLRRRWATPSGAEPRPRITVIPSRYRGHLAAAATTGAEIATGTYLAFLDDDAAATPDWLERLLLPFGDPSVVAVGGAPLPVYATPRPHWFPPEFDWVFGCAYLGLPSSASATLHLIGTTMAVRRSDLLAIGGIHSDDHGDLEMSHRLLQSAPGSKLIYEPSAVVHHYVHANRLTWSYFWRRCFFANRRKVVTVRSLGPAGNLAAERGYVLRTLSRGFLRGLGHGVRGDRGGLLRAAAICAGLGLSTVGYAVGTIEWYVTGRRMLTRVAEIPATNRDSSTSAQ